MHKYVLLAYVCAPAVAACVLHNPVPVQPEYPAGEYPPDGGSATEEPEGSSAALTSPCGRACTAFSRLGCPEGRPSDNGVSCYRVCVKTAKVKKLPAACWAGASSVAALRACGGIRCVP